LEAEVEQEDQVDDAVDDEEPINLTRTVDEGYLDKGDDGREQESCLRHACNSHTGETDGARAWSAGAVASQPLALSVEAAWGEPLDGNPS
jgi:hypothetical protein